MNALQTVLNFAKRAAELLSIEQHPTHGPTGDEWKAIDEVNSLGNDSIIISRETALRAIKALSQDLTTLDVNHFRESKGRMREVSKIMTGGNRAYARYLSEILAFADAVGITDEEELFALMTEGKRKY